MAYKSEPRVKNFRGILLYIQNNLTEREHLNLVFLNDLPEKDAEDCKKDICSFWNYMLKRQNEHKYCEEDPSDLFDDLEEIGRQDLSNKAKLKYERLKQYKLSRSQGHTSPNLPGPGTPNLPGPGTPNQLSPGSPAAGSGHVVVPQSPYLQGPGPTPTTPQPQQPPPPYQVSPPYNSPGYGQDGTSPGATDYEQPRKVPGSQNHGPIQLSNKPPSPKSPPNSGSLQQTPTFSPPPTLSPPPTDGGTGHGLKSTEPLPTMSSNLVQRGGLTSVQSAPGVVNAHTGQGVSLPGSLQSEEPTHNPPRNAMHASGSAFPVQPSSAQAGSGSGLKSSEPLRTMPSDIVPGQGETVSASPAHLSPVNPDSIISKASSLKSNDPTGNGLSSNVNVKEFQSANSDSVISSAGALKSSDPSGVNQPTSPQIQVPAHTSSLQAAGSTKHTLQYPIQPSSTPDQVNQDLGNLSLREAEEIVFIAPGNSFQQQPVLGEADTVSDGAGAACGIGALSQDVVTDSASDLEQTGDLAARGLASFILDQPLKDQKKTITLRKYQEELADLGLQDVNYVICAPTGSGKTITAAHICYENMKKMKKAGRKDDFKAIFIVPTRHLKKQQRDGFQDIFVPGQVTSLAEGQSFNDAFGKGNVRVLMITAQVLVNSLTQNEFRLPDASMLVFDECHHTTLNHPYNEIMRYYLKEKKAILDHQGIPKERWPVGRPCGKIPQVVGLTASVGTGTSDDAHGHIVTLCANLDSFGVKIVNVPDNVKEMEDLNKPPEQDEIKDTPKRKITPTSSRFIEILETIMEEIEKNVLAKHQKEYENTNGVTVYSPTYGTQAYENWIAKIRAHAELRFPDLEICANYLFRLNLALLLYEDLRAVDALESIEVFMQKMKGIQADLTDGRHCRMIYEKNLQELKKLASIDNSLSNPKLLYLQGLIRREYNKDPKSKGIVLARTRFATYALQNFIKSSDELKEEPRIQSVRIVGQSKEIDQGQTLARQEGALNDFKSDRANLLVATDIVQEGLDIPACNLIIRYNFVSDEIGTVQSKGRARKEGSKCYLIVETGSVNEARENKNRERVVEMARAIEEANALPREAWHQEIRQRQLTIIDEIMAKDEQKRIQQEESKQVNVKLMCNKCEKFICKSSDLERRLANYTCLDPTIGERTRIVGTGHIQFRESRTIGIVKCRCGNQLGQALEFKRLHVWKPGYNFSPKSFLFIYNDDPASKQRFAKWKKVDFPIASEEQ